MPQGFSLQDSSLTRSCLWLDTWTPGYVWAGLLSAVLNVIPPSWKGVPIRLPFHPLSWSPAVLLVLAIFNDRVLQAILNQCLANWKLERLAGHSQRCMGASPQGNATCQDAPVIGDQDMMDEYAWPLRYQLQLEGDQDMMDEYAWPLRYQLQLEEEERSMKIN
jgi:hypothetical protein